MLGKVFKYDMKAMNRSLMPGYIILLLLALLTKGMGLLATKVPLFGTIANFSAMLFVLMVIGIFFYTLVIVIMRFYKNLIKEEGYLTHTLPVKKSTLILSKLLTANIYYLLTLIVACIAVTINVYGAPILGTIWQFIEQAIIAAGLTVPHAVIYIALFLTFSTISQTLFIYVSICLGQTRNDKKLMYSVVYGIIVYMVVQLISALEIGFLFLINPELRSITNDTIPTMGTMAQIFALSGIVSVIVTIAYYIISVKVLDRKLNLE